MNVKMLIALAASALFATSFAVAESQSMQAIDNGGASMQAAPAPIGPENVGTPGANEQQMLSDNSNISAAQMPGDMASSGSSDDVTADNATGDDY